MNSPIWIKRAFTVALVFLVAPSFSADKNLADVWIVKPNAGQWQSFETAFKRHADYRKEQKDPRTWMVYQPIVGDDLDYYVIRACCFSWSDMDGYRDWGMEAKTGDHWSKHVDQYVASAAHYVAAVDMKNSNWPETETGFKYFEVITSYPKPGHGPAISADRKKISDAAKAMNWPESWSWNSYIGGKSRTSLVFAYKNYADMEAIEPSFMEQLGKHLGSKEKATELMKSWNSHFKGSNSTIYSLNEDMSMK